MNNIRKVLADKICRKIEGFNEWMILWMRKMDRLFGQMQAVQKESFYERICRRKSR